MRVSQTRSMFDNQPRTYECSWPELVAFLRNVKVTACTRADCLSLQPGTKKCPHRGMNGDVGMWGPSIFDGEGKSLPNVIGMDLLTYDVDNVTRDQLGAIDAAVQAEGLACIMYATHSSDPEHNDYSVRFVMPLAGPITVQRGDRRFDAALREFRRYWAERLKIPDDKATKDESRLYFNPTVPQGTRYTFGTTEGKPVPLSALRAEKIETAPTRGGADSRLAGAGGEGSATASVPVWDGDIDALRKALVAHAQGENKVYAKRAANGEALCPDSGQRNVTLTALVGSMVYALPWGTPIAAMVELLRPSLGHWSPPNENTHGRDWLEAAELLLERALKRREPEEQAKAVKEAALAEEGGLDYIANAKAAKAAQADPQASTSDKYTDAELESFYAKAGVKDASEFRKLWIIRSVGASWIWTEGAYQTALTDKDFRFAILRDLHRAPIELFIEDPKRGLVPRHPDDILNYYSSVALKVEGSLSSKASTYDPHTKTFHEALCPARPLVPTYDEDVNAWLVMLGGDAVLDWVAGVSQLERMCAAIYLKGKKGLGKTLFANGLSRIWRKGGPSTFKDSVSVGFNSSIADCPLIFADETLPKTATITDDLRALLGTNHQTLNRKFMPTTSVTGCVRLIIAANNENLLNTSARLEADDISAMADRVLYVDRTGDNRPAEFINHLKATKGVDHIAAWVDKDVMAKHALWLAQARKLDYTKRFLVDGSPDFASQLTQQSGVVGLVLEFLCRYLGQDSRSAQPSQLIKAGGGALLVNSELMADRLQWERFVPSHKVLSAQAIAQVLRQVSTGVVTVGTKDFHAVNVPAFLKYAKKAQVGDYATIAGRIEAP